MPKDKEWKDLSFEERTREMGKTEKGRKILEEGKLQSDENEEMRLQGELYSSGQFADEEEGGYVGDINESDYSPDDEYEEDGDYEGEIKNGIPHGQGTYMWSDGSIYEGEFKEGEKHGQGTQTYPNRSIKYEGEFKNDGYHGKGTFTFPDGQKYVGEWKNGKYHGQGTYTSQNGTKGKGEFKDNTPWNISLYGKYGNFTGKYVNGVKQ